MKEFTLEELAEFDGREGRPAYVAYDGMVYDVTESVSVTAGVGYAVLSEASLSFLGLALKVTKAIRCCL